MEFGDQNLTPQEPSLLDQINAIMRELGSTAKWKRVPERIEGTEVLKDKKIVMVDDTQLVLETFVPDLMVATDGKAAFIKYSGQNLLQLIEQIQQTKADVVLLDYDLSETLKGSTVTRALFARGFAGSVIGFSSDDETQGAFQEAGALGSASKGSWAQEDSVKKIAELLEK